MIPVLRVSLVATLAMGVLAVGGCSSSSCCRPGATFPGVLHGVSATSATDAWAVGVDSTPPGSHTLILHWNGAAWSRVASPSPTANSELLSVSAASATSAWAVGQYCTSACDSAPQPHALILHWNGTVWSRVFRPTPAGPSFLGVTATSATSAWAVGFYATASGQPRTLIMHWTGTRWSQS